MFSGLIKPTPEPARPGLEGESLRRKRSCTASSGLCTVCESLLQRPLSGAAAPSRAQGQGLLTFDTSGR